MRINEVMLRRYVRSVLQEDNRVWRVLDGQTRPEDEAKAYAVIDAAYNSGVDKAMGRLGEDIAALALNGDNLNTPQTPTFRYADVYVPSENALYSVKSGKTKDPLGGAKGMRVGSESDIEYIKERLGIDDEEKLKELNFGFVTFGVVKGKGDNDSYELELVIYPTISYDQFSKQGGAWVTKNDAENLFGNPAKTVQATLKKPEDYTRPIRRDVRGRARVQRQFSDLYGHLMDDDDDDADKVYQALKDALPPDAVKQ